MRSFLRGAFLALLLALGACSSIPYERAGTLPAAAHPPDGSPERAALNARVYDAAAGHVQRLFYREDFGSVDFAGQAAARRDAALAQADETGFYAELGALLDLLDDDHTYARGPTERARYAARKAGEAQDGYGMVLTVVGEDWLVAMVRPGTPAAEAGVLPGWQVLRIGGRPVPASAPPLAGRTDEVVFLDEAGAERTLALAARTLPPLPRREARRLEGDVAYLRFDDFDKPTLDWFGQQMRALAEAPPSGLVLDLRRNGGGSIDAAALVHAFLYPQRQEFAVLAGRLIDRRLYAPAPAYVYDGPLAVLTGPASASASELLAARVQETGRGQVVGQRTRGAVVGTRGIDLPDGGLLHVGMIVMTTAGGRTLEKTGVTPDVAVEIDWRAVREGRDPELAAALAALAARAALEG